MRAPAAEPLTLLAILRLMLGAMFVWVFFENLGKGLYTPEGYASLIRYYIEKGSAPLAWKAVMGFMAGHAAIVAPLQATAELGFGVLLVLGLASRAVALAAFGFLTSLWVSEWGTAWIWELLVPMVVAACPSLVSPRCASRS
ncbi:MAG: DoxX family membrane protein [Deltaproteobacteria bacterium]|nr:MAG: DoxX family membrane protein [Deltaproteobacteria bacterium]